MRMKADMATILLALPNGREIDWRAAARAVRNAGLEGLPGGDDARFPSGHWLVEGDEPLGAELAFTALRAAQADLFRRAGALRGAIERGRPAELVDMQMPTHRVWVVAGPPSGDCPCDLLRATRALVAIGVTAAAGFELRTGSGVVAIGDRGRVLSAAEHRLVRFGLAAGHIAEEAAALAASGGPSSPVDQEAGCWRELDSFSGGPADDRRRLMRFAARSLALGALLEDPGRPPTPEPLDRQALMIVRQADQGGLRRRPVCTGLEQISRELRDLASGLPASPAAGDRRAVVTMSRVAIAALVDLAGDVPSLMESEPQAIPPVTPEEPATDREAPASGLSLVGVDKLDWRTAELGIDLMRRQQRLQLRGDLAEFNRMVTGDDRRPRATSGDQIGPHRLFIAAPREPDEPDVAHSIERLAHAGILDLAGVLCWSVPAPTDGRR